MTERKPYLAICAIYRWDADYLREWIAFHRIVGAERFYLYDNGSDDDHLEALAPFLEDRSVVLHEWPFFPGQPSAYEHCLEHYRDGARWIAFLDTDEFLFSPTGRPVSELLVDFERWPGVGVNRVVMGTSGHRSKPPGLVIENYVHRLDDPDPNLTIKTIVDPARVERRLNPHAFAYKDGALAVDEHMVPFERWVTRSHTTDVLRINHYYTKSEDEALLKFARPHPGTGRPRPVVSRNGLRRFNERYGVRDDTILMHLPALREELRRLERRAAGRPS